MDLIRLVGYGVPTEADLAGDDVGDFDRRADLRSEDKAVGDATVDTGGRFLAPRLTYWPSAALPRPERGGDINKSDFTPS